MIGLYVEILGLHAQPFFHVAPIMLSAVLTAQDAILLPGWEQHWSEDRFRWLEQ